MATICSDFPAAIRSRYGKVSWQTGQLTLSNASSAGPAARISSSVFFPPSRLFNSNDGALTPASSMAAFFFPHMSAGLLPLFLLLDEVEDVEVLDFAFGEKAVHRLLLVSEDLHHGRKLGEQQKLDVPPIEVYQLHRATRLLQPGKANHHGAEAGAIDIIDVLQIEDH